jgi:hypothetical protein
MPWIPVGSGEALFSQRYRFLFFSLQTVEEMFFGNGKPRIVNHSTKDPIAARFGITCITPELIAYGACQVRSSTLDAAFLEDEHIPLGSLCPQLCIRVADAGYDIRFRRFLLQRSIPI